MADEEVNIEKDEALQVDEAAARKQYVAEQTTEFTLSDLEVEVQRRKDQAYEEKLNAYPPL